MASHRHIGTVGVRRLLQMAAWLGACAAILVGTRPSARAVEGAEGVTAVASRVSKDYVRVKLADGSWQPEEYAFGKGGDYGDPIHDDTIDKMDFLDIARVIAGPLAEQRYLPSKDPARTRLMIMVYWGTTDVPEPITTTAAYQFYKSSLEEYNALKSVDQSAADAALSAGLAELNFENNRRDKIDFKNAEMIGYDSDGAGLIGTDRGSILQFTALRHERDGLVPEIEENRYFVVLMAYDFQMMWKEKKHKLLWETRFSINQPRNDFGKALPAMAKFASSYFGQASHGLVRQEIPEGHVEVGAPTLVEWLFPTKK